MLGISGIAFLSTITPTASSTISNVVASSLMTLFIGGLSSIPYFETRKYLKNVDINEIKEQIEQNELEIGKNIEKSELNDKKIENIDNRKFLVFYLPLYTFFYYTRRLSKKQEFIEKNYSVSLFAIRAAFSSKNIHLSIFSLSSNSVSSFFLAISFNLTKSLLFFT